MVQCLDGDPPLEVGVNDVDMPVNARPVDGAWPVLILALEVDRGSLADEVLHHFIVTSQRGPMQQRVALGVPHLDPLVTLLLHDLANYLDISRCNKRTYGNTHVRMYVSVLGNITIFVVIHNI